MNKKRMLAIAIVVVVLMLLAGLIRKRKKELSSVPSPASYAAVVRVAPVKTGYLYETVKYLGEIVPVTEYIVASKVSGFIENIFVEEGNQVREGDVLVKIDDREILERIASIKARVEATRSNMMALQAKIPGLKSAVNTARGIFRRDKTLYKNKAIGKEELDVSSKNFMMALSELRATENSIKSLSSTISSLEAEKKSQEVLLSYTTIRAPFSGVVSQRILSSGDLAVPGKPILKVIAPEAGVKIVVRMSPEDLVKMKVGIPVRLNFNGEVEYSFVSSIYPGTSPNSLGIVNVICTRPPFGLPFHSKLEVELVKKSLSGMIAPLPCLFRKGEKNFVVMLNKENRAEIVSVNLRGVNDRSFCFSSCKIHVGDRLVSARESRLMRIFAGQQVEVIDE